MRLFLIFLLLSFILTNCPTENDPNLVEVTTSVSPEDAGVVNPPEGSYMIGREVTLKTEATDDRWEFAGWSGDTTASEDSLTFVISRDMNLTANYEIPSDERPFLTTSVAPSEAGIVEPDSGQFDIDESVNVEAVPNDGWEFVEWSGDTSATENPLNLTMNKSYELIANFEELPSLTTTAEPEEGGTIEPAEGQFEFNETIDIEAIPNEGWEFVEWSGDTSATENPLNLTMDKGYELFAGFKQLSQAFTNQITVSDGVNSMNLSFGMDENATPGFDSGIDRELPPPPPGGSFYGQFNIPDYFLAEDFRPVQEQETIWELEVAPDSGQTITLSWDYSDTDQIGTLILTDDLEEPSVEVDMKSETTYEASEESGQVFYIISDNESN